MQSCMHCSKQIADDAGKCPYCGGNNSIAIALIACAIVAMLGVAVGWLITPFGFAIALAAGVLAGVLAAAD